MAMAGNSLIKYKNMGGQVSRRTAVVNFAKKVIEVDQNLDKKITERNSKYYENVYNWLFMGCK